MSTYRHIAQRQAHAPVRQLCQALRVAPSTYYAWHRQQQSGVELAWQMAMPWAAGASTACSTPKAYPPSSPACLCPAPPTPTRPCAPNCLLGQPAFTAPNQVWAGDITYLLRQGGWLYLSMWLDRCSRKVVG